MVGEKWGACQMCAKFLSTPCSAATLARLLANLEIIEEKKLVANSAKLGKILDEQLESIKNELSDVIGFAPSVGLVGGLLMTKPGTKEPDYELAWNVINNCFHKGLLMFAPVGVGGGCVKIAPPLCITEGALKEGCGVIREAIKQAVRK